MQKLKQVMILSGSGNEVATLGIEKKFGGTTVELKVFNLRDRENLELGMYIDGKVIKETIDLGDSDTYTTKLKDVGELKNISALIVRKEGEIYTPIMWSKKECKYDEILAEFNAVYSQNVENVESIKVSNFEDKSELFEASEDEIEEVIDNAMEYVEDDEDFFKEENEKLGNFEGKEFFELIADQVDDLFDNYPRVDELEELITNSKWVKINFENTSEYVLGLIYDGFDLRYICYGVPGKYGSEEPKRLGKCQWLPLNPKDPDDGYWVIYQDATTGDKVDVI